MHRGQSGCCSLIVGDAMHMIVFPSAEHPTFVQDRISDVDVFFVPQRCGFVVSRLHSFDHSPSLRQQSERLGR
jgi:hypothetical protein